jgi:hypothetical protein
VDLTDVQAPIHVVQAINTAAELEEVILHCFTQALQGTRITNDPDNLIVFDLVIVKLRRNRLGFCREYLAAREQALRIFVSEVKQVLSVLDLVRSDIQLFGKCLICKLWHFGFALSACGLLSRVISHVGMLAQY